MPQSKTSNKINKIVNTFFDIVTLSIIFTIFSIPVITMGGSFTALHSIIIQKIEGNTAKSVWKIFIEEFKRKFKDATLVWTVLFLLIIGFAEVIRYGLRADWFSSGGIGSCAMVVSIVLLYFVVMICMYAFPLLAKFNTNKKVLIKNALLLSVKNFFITVILMFCMAVIALLFYFKTIFACILFSVLGFGAYAYFHDILMLKCFAPYLEPLFDQEKEKNDEDEIKEKTVEIDSAVNSEEDIQPIKEMETQENEADNKTNYTPQEEATDIVTEEDEIELEELPKRKTIKLSDAAEDEKMRKIEKEKAAEEKKRAAVEEADKEARAKAKELADRVKENISYETTGENVYRRTNNDDMNKNNARGNNTKKKQRKR